MVLPPNILARLRSGRAVAAEAIAPQPGVRAYLLILPLAPRQCDYPDHWLSSGSGEPWLRDPSDITGYEIRYLQHDATYTDAEWGWEYDQVLADLTTRIKRIFVQKIDDIEGALAPWRTTQRSFQHPHTFDSSLLSSPIDGYLEHADVYPHLWQP